ncbi:hypothetical protein D3C80_1709340 [compost metagenome]
MSRRASGTSSVANELAACRVSLLRSSFACLINQSVCSLKAARPLRTSSLSSTAKWVISATSLRCFWSVICSASPRPDQVAISTPLRLMPLELSAM